MQNEEMKRNDVVTMTLFSKEKGNGEFDMRMFNEVENIKQIIAGLTAAAERSGQKPPKFVLYVNLIPDWARGQDHADSKDATQSTETPQPLDESEKPSYAQLDQSGMKKRFMNAVAEAFKDVDIEVVDFYKDVATTSDERAYLHGLLAGGSNPDMMKTCAIINNAASNHLQIDSNTKIIDFSAFYKKTFDADVPMDALNASYYDHHYVSAHNKVVYTPAGSPLTLELTRRYFDHVTTHKHNPEKKIPRGNFIYSEVFTSSLESLKLVRKSADPSDGWVFYPALMDNPQYRISANIATAVNMSWSTDKPRSIADLEELPTVKYGDTSIDFQAFVYLIKKCAGNLWQQSLGQKKSLDPRKPLIHLSDIVQDMRIVAAFYENVRANNPAMLPSLIRVIPMNTIGMNLANILFEKSLVYLYANPDSPCKLDNVSTTFYSSYGLFKQPPKDAAHTPAKLPQGLFASGNEHVDGNIRQEDTQPDTQQTNKRSRS